MTDAQKRMFAKKIEEYFYTLNKIVNGELTKIPEDIYNWGKSLYSRYRYAINGDKPKYALPTEHIEVLRNVLKYKNITEEDFKQSLGKIDLLAEILREKIKNEVENYSLEELEKLRQQYDEELSSLEQKHSMRYKKLYSISDEEYNSLETKINELKSKRKHINKIIEKKAKDSTQKNEKTPLTTGNKQRKQAKYNEKITELMKENADQKEEIEELRKELDTQKQEKQKDILEYQGNYEKRLAERQQQLEEQYNQEIERKTSMIEIESNRKIKELKEELERQKRILTNQSKDTKERQQQLIVKLLCSTDNVSLETIKNHLDNEKIPTEGLEISIKELRNLIPGITRVISDEDTPVYSLRTNSFRQFDAYKEDIISPRISNVLDGKVEFVVRSDLHMNMTNSEDTLKKYLEPYMNFCAKRNNIPIVDLGDLAETIIGIKYASWRDFDKETAKLAYKFYKNYAKAIASAPEIRHYILFGNHDEHPYHVGVDPMEILQEYSSNFKPLGIAKGEFKIGNDRIGVFHDKSWQNVVSYQEYSKEERNEYIYNYLCNEMETIAQNYIYSLIGHYHFGAHNTEKSFSVINNGLENSLLFTAEVKDGYVEKMYVTEVGKRDYKIEIYNRGNQYRK